MLTLPIAAKSLGELMFSYIFYYYNYYFVSVPCVYISLHHCPYALCYLLYCTNICPVNSRFIGKKITLVMVLEIFKINLFISYF